MSSVYLLHLDPPLLRGVIRVRHYVGFCHEDDPARRIERHVRGRGASLTAAVVRAGGAVTLVYQWPGATREFERRVKAQKNYARWCPGCGLHTRPMPDPSRLTRGAPGAQDRT